jgi:hypothetical protein
VPDSLSGEGSTPAAGQHRRVELVGGFDHRLDITLVARHHDPDGLNLIHGSIRRIEQARISVEVNVSLHTLLQVGGDLRIFILCIGLHVDLSN